MDYAKESLRLHEQWKGKIEVTATVPVQSKEDLALAYTPGVAQPCLEIQKDCSKSYDLTPAAQPVRCDHRWLCCSGPRRYWPRSGDAGHGGQMRAL